MYFWSIFIATFTDQGSIILLKNSNNSAQGREFKKIRGKSGIRRKKERKPREEKVKIKGKKNYIKRRRNIIILPY